MSYEELDSLTHYCSSGWWLAEMVCSFDFLCSDAKYSHVVIPMILSARLKICKTCIYHQFDMNCGFLICTMDAIQQIHHKLKWIWEDKKTFATMELYCTCFCFDLSEHVCKQPQTDKTN